MKPLEIANRRLYNQDLVAPSETSATQVVAMLGAVQAQDYPGSKWGIAQRMVAGTTDALIEAEIESGAIVRTHILRPTWHFVAASDIRWMLELTAPRVHSANAYSYRRLELDDAVFRKSRAALGKSLEGGKHLTRGELAEAFKRARIDLSDPQRVAHIMMRAELDGVVCSGARRGKQFTYALLEERAPRATVLERDAALAELTRRYFQTRGPATIDDYSWWSGLTKADCRRGVQIVGSELATRTIDGRQYWLPHSAEPPKLNKPLAHMLPNYDEYFVGFRDRAAMVHRLTKAGVKPRVDALSGNLLTINGQVVGGWRRTMGREAALVTLDVRTELTRAEHRAIDAVVERFGVFLGVKTRVSAPSAGAHD